MNYQNEELLDELWDVLQKQEHLSCKEVIEALQSTIDALQNVRLNFPGNRPASWFKPHARSLQKR